MKRCPECRRDYYDDTLLYCLDDGNALLEGPASGQSVPPAVAGGLTPSSDLDNEQRTAILSAPSTGDTESLTAILQPPTTAGGTDSRRMVKPLIAMVAVLVVAETASRPSSHAAPRPKTSS